MDDHFVDVLADAEAFSDKLDEELGNPTGRKDPNWVPYEPTILEPGRTPLHAVSEKHVRMPFSVTVQDYDDIRPLVSSSSYAVVSAVSATNFHQVYAPFEPPKSRVVLPDGVKAA